MWMQTTRLGKCQNLLGQALTENNHWCCMVHMIAQISLENFKGITKADIPLGRLLTALNGHNGSGKRHASPLPVDTVVNLELQVSKILERWIA